MDTTRWTSFSLERQNQHPVGGAAGSIRAFPRAPFVAFGVALFLRLGHLHEDVASEKVGIVEFQRLLRRLGRLERDVAEPARFALIVAAQSKVENLAALSEKLSQRPSPRRDTTDS